MIAIVLAGNFDGFFDTFVCERETYTLYLQTFFLNPFVSAGRGGNSGKTNTGHWNQCILNTNLITIF